jgi:hypothetical protein
MINLISLGLESSILGSSGSIATSKAMSSTASMAMMKIIKIMSSNIRKIIISIPSKIIL